MSCRNFSASLFALCFLLSGARAWSMAQPAVICESTVGTARTFSKIQYVGDFADLKLPLSIEQVEDKKRFAEMLRDLQMPSFDETRNFVFKIEGRDRILGFLANVKKDIASSDKHVREEFFFEHFISLSMPLIPFKVWAKQLMGKPLLAKREGMFGGWFGLFWVPAGIVWAAFKNPIVSGDRYLYLKIQNDDQYVEEIKTAAAQFLTLDPKPIHIHRDLTAEMYRWGGFSGQPADVLTVDEFQQTRMNTMPVVERVFWSVVGLFKKKENPPLDIKTDILFNAETEKMILIVRTKEKK